MRVGGYAYMALLAVMIVIGAAGHEASSQAVIATNPPVMSQSYVLNPDAPGAGPHCFRIATLPADNVGDDDHLHMMVNLNYSWSASVNATIDVVFGSRNGFTYSYTVRGATPTSQAKLVAYRNGDTSVDIYLLFANVYAAASYIALETTEDTVYSAPADLGATIPQGTLVFDSSSASYPPASYADFSGNYSIGTTTDHSHKLLVRDVETNGVVWSMAVNNPINMQGSSSPGVGIKLALSTEESGGNEANKWDGLLAYTEPGSDVPTLSRIVQQSSPDQRHDVAGRRQRWYRNNEPTGQA